MEENINKLKDRVIDTLKETDLDYIRTHMDKIQGSTICAGSGGSKVVASFAGTVLGAKNRTFTSIMEPRDVLYERGHYDNLFLASYSGTNYGVEVLRDIDKPKYLLTYGSEIEGYRNLSCKSALPKEKSFISLGATLMPMSVLLSYYDKSAISSLLDHFTLPSAIPDFGTYDFEVMSGLDTNVASTFLDSTFIESGMSYLVVHHKYDYCHGRSVLSKEKRSNLIYLINKRTNLDDTLLEVLTGAYNEIFVLEGVFDDSVLNEYYLTLKAMLLSCKIAQSRGIDLSHVDYPRDIVKKLYKYQNGM